MHGVGSAGRGGWAAGRIIDARYVSRETPHLLETLARTIGADRGSSRHRTTARDGDPGAGGEQRDPAPGGTRRQDVLCQARLVGWAR